MSEVQQLVFDYASVIRVQETRSEFAKYLKEVEHNEEGLEFVHDVDAFQQLIVQGSIVFSAPSIQQTYTKIFNDYIPRNSPKELNLSHVKRQNVLRGVEEMNTLFASAGQNLASTNLEQIKVKLYQIFEESKQFIMHQIQMDSFPRFIRSQDWQKFCAKNVELKEQVCKQLQIVPLFTTAEFLNPLPNARELQIARYFIQDSNQWKLFTVMPFKWDDKSEQHKVNFYKFDQSIVVSDEKDYTSASCFKFTYSMPFSYKKIIQGYMNKEHLAAIDTHYKYLQIFFPQQGIQQQFNYAYARTLMQYTLPFANTREILSNVIFTKFKNEDGTKTYLMVQRTVLDESIPKQNPKNVRIIAFTVFSCTKHTKDSCRVVVSSYLNMKGVIQQVMSLATKALMKQMVKDAKKSIRFHQQHPNLPDNLGFKAIMDYNKKVPF